MQKPRQLVLTSKDHPGQSVLYVMSRDQRTTDNHALLAAQQEALSRKLPLVVQFNVLPNLGVRGREHFTFMIDGLMDVSENLQKHNIPFHITQGSATENILRVCKEIDPRTVYFDFSPLHGPRQVVEQVAKLAKGSVIVVDAHNIIPVWLASNKQEFAARTFRPKIHKLLEEYLVEPEVLQPHPYALQQKLVGLSLPKAKQQLQTIPNRGITPPCTPGEKQAKEHLRQFITTSLHSYATGRNDVANDHQSGFSPYLHFGHIASLRVALEVLYTVNKRPLLFDRAEMAQSGVTPDSYDGMNALFEEMIVRKELSDNFCLYAKSYTTLSGAPEWAQKTLDEHRADPRQYIYSLEQLEHSQTHDAAWNAAQTQLTASGKMHGYMRMYWAKKILEWTTSPEQAIDYALYLNDAYSLDGGDPNGYVGVLWSVAGLHDRPWTERPIFGKIRYMNEAGLRRKFDLQTYIEAWTKP